jgi:glycosyltransferase involved in cell wall biosynthesis
LPLEALVPQHIVPLPDAPYTLTDKLQVRLHMARRIAAMEEHSRRCAEAIGAGSFDILFANSCMFLFSPAIGRHLAIPSVLYLQEPNRPLYEALPDPFWAAPTPVPGRGAGSALKEAFVDVRRIRNARLQVREEVRNAKSYGRILCNSYFSRENILRSYGVDAEVCYLGIDERQFQAGPPEREPLIVGVGSFRPEKNPRLCIEAVACMKAPRPPLLWIANSANADHLADMKALAGQRGVAFEVRVGVSDEELVASLQKASAMIYAPRLEPFGLAPLEASACGTPVVVIAEGGLRETFVDGVNGLVADPTPAALADALERLLADSAAARRIGQEGRREAETKWTHRAATERLIAKLQAELERTRPVP